jgi:DNA polymerase V
MAQLCEPGTTYHKAGVVLDGLEPPSMGQQLGLFGPVVPEATAPMPIRIDQPQLMDTLDALTRASSAARCSWAVLS